MTFCKSAIYFLFVGIMTIAAPGWASSDRFVVAISDLHVGAGKDATGKYLPVEDFRWESDFSAFLKKIAENGNNKVDLILAGDVFELWQSPTMACSKDLSKPGCVIKDCAATNKNLSCTEEEAVARLRYVLGQHPQFITLLNDFIATGDNRIYLVPGNHDAALLLPRANQLLRTYFQSSRIIISNQGYWLSDDGRIYADHGHQFDKVNRYPNWPNPTVMKDGVLYMHRPWGEAMVQEFYDQYEYLFPVIDNLKGEVEGAKYALGYASLLQKSTAATSLLRFMVLGESLSQHFDFLGDDDSDDEYPTWNYEILRTKPLSFFVDTIEQNNSQSQELRQLFDASALDTSPGFTDEQIDMICSKKSLSPDRTAQCPTMKPQLGGVYNLVTDYSDREMRKHLAQTLPEIGGSRPYLADLYIFGHTHAARDNIELPLGETSKGIHTITAVNTGAFHRISKLANINTDKTKPPIGPEALPPCYNFVLVPPYAGTPVAVLNKWVQDQSGKWSVGIGTCLE